MSPGPPCRVRGPHPHPVPGVLHRPDRAGLRGDRADGVRQDPGLHAARHHPLQQPALPQAGGGAHRPGFGSYKVSSVQILTVAGLLGIQKVLFTSSHCRLNDSGLKFMQNIWSFVFVI